eukprot:GHRQ01037904.1.p1 GENE.GHRQ01037904.1~~GHRQ01037904.1.p1  ORF type:complete len:230 (+),score=45.40 GHRQ01037904.1:131-820(+)
MEQKNDMSVHAIQGSESEASLYSSTSDWAAEHTIDTGIKLPPGTLTYKIAVLELHPTQLAVGMQQVHAKMSKVAKKQQKGPEALEKFLQSHPVPVVLGPGQQRYLIDHHHLCYALHTMGVESCCAGTVCDYSELTQEQFWVAMARHNYLWQYKPDGSAVSLSELPGLLPHTIEGEQQQGVRRRRRHAWRRKLTEATHMYLALFRKPANLQTVRIKSGDSCAKHKVELPS